MKENRQLPNRIERTVGKHPVAVTGIGMVCPLGISTPVVWENMLKGKSGIQPITKFDAGDCATKFGGQLPEDYHKLEKEKTPKRLFKKTVVASRMIRLCAQEALNDSAYEIGQTDPYRCGVIIGTSGASVRSPEDLGGPSTQRWKIVREMINAPAAWLSIENGFRGPSYSISAGYASGSYAIARAFDLIQMGIIDVAIAGGVDCLLTKNNVKRGNQMNLLATRNSDFLQAVRPFDKNRDGFVLSDGGCAVLLESWSHARERNAEIYAFMQGYGYFSQPGRSLPVQNAAKDMEQAIELALVNSGISKEKIAYVNANGTASINDDVCETVALKRVFGQQAHDLLISSQKSMIGHCVGGADAIEFAVTALTLKTQKIPPTINYQYQDPDCDLNYVPNSMTMIADYQSAIMNSFGFGGSNCVIVLTKSP
jgi:3-oxoacyl-[acyl-carrier-protein] synthase II